MKTNEDIVIERWLENKIKQIIQDGNYDYADNHRYAYVNDPEAMKKYDEAQKRGCCGFYEAAVTCPIDLKVYLIGFNYGH